MHIQLGKGEDTMARYYFHFVSRADKIEDRCGVELEGPYEAHKHALGLIRRTHSLVVGQPWRGWAVQVDDAHGQSVLTAPFIPELAPLKSFGKRRHHYVSAENERGLTDETSKRREGEW